jgi:hypothetical protein
VVKVLPERLVLLVAKVQLVPQVLLVVKVLPEQLVLLVAKVQLVPQV